MKSLFHQLRKKKKEKEEKKVQFETTCRKNSFKEDLTLYSQSQPSNSDSFPLPKEGRCEPSCEELGCEKVGCEKEEEWCF